MTRQAAIKTLYDHPSDMEPLLPGDGDSKSSSLALALIRGAERLRTSLHPTTRKLVADLVCSMNSYYSNLIQVKDATNAHSIRSVQILGIGSTSANDFGKIIVYYCTTQTDFNPDGSLVTPANCVGSYSITSTTGGSVSGSFPVAISAGGTHYIELVAYAGSSGTVGDTIQFKIAVQWV